MKSVAIVFGGSGYIGRNLLSKILEEQLFDKIYICDINPLSGFDNQIKIGKITFLKIDVREAINIDVENVDTETSWIFNFAAIHREPGHAYQEYFDTNIPGTENVNEFARRTGKKIFFSQVV